MTLWLSVPKNTKNICIKELKHLAILKWSNIIQEAVIYYISILESKYFSDLSFNHGPNFLPHMFWNGGHAIPLQGYCSPENNHTIELQAGPYYFQWNAIYVKDGMQNRGLGLVYRN